MKVKEANMLLTSMLMEKDILGTNRKLIVIGAGAKNQIPRFNGTLYLTLLSHNHALAKKEMKRAHEQYI